MQDCKRANNDRRTSDRRIQNISVEKERRLDSRRSGLDRRLLSKA
tara:strand:- start:294 stop:428 length:135 start_codon:yes stop_codon:yes gene_type:complete